MYERTRINEDIVRLVLPYKDIFTTVFVLRSEAGAVIFDTATTEEDMEQGLLPLLRQERIDPEQVRAVVISHNHRDHAGGLPCLMEHLPRAQIFSRSPALKERYPDRVLAPEDGERLLDVYRAVTVPGHTEDSMALLDERTGTLIAGDCLQLYGIYGSGQWGANITLPAAHLQAVEKLRNMDIGQIFCAHDYHPCGHCACGTDEIRRMLDACKAPLCRLRELILEEPSVDNEAVLRRYQAEAVLPTVPEKVVAALRAALDGGEPLQ